MYTCCCLKANSGLKAFGPNARSPKAFGPNARSPKAFRPKKRLVWSKRFSPYSVFFEKKFGLKTNFQKCYQPLRAQEYIGVL